eukprot:Phypoly_transcript_01865.p1 GENE.Phypoly_transcript_01865~~Phypoly_transcript_01865.p1  ORF type:complete len:1003 (-),score=254.47 Phypoly_transcript_01865:8-3016(-)
MFPTKRSLSPTPPALSKKAKVEEICCFFCSFSKEKTKDEGELQEFKIKGKRFYVHENCLVFSGRLHEESDEEIVKRVTAKPGNYKCKADPCACKKPGGATIGCHNKKCKMTFHYRCALTVGSLLPTGNFYCHRHIEDARSIIEHIKSELDWPGNVPYLLENDWSEISPEDRKLIASSTTGWDTWTTTHDLCVKIVKVNSSHWTWTENMPYDLQATEHIRVEEAICEIVGVVRKIDIDNGYNQNQTDVYLPSKNENKFMSAFTEGDTKRLVIDSSKSGNEGRYVNFLTEKAKQMKLTSNCKVVTLWSMGKLKVVIMATADIRPNESVILDDSLINIPETDKPTPISKSKNQNSIKNEKNAFISYHNKGKYDDGLDSDEPNEDSAPPSPAASSPDSPSPDPPTHSPTPAPPTPNHSSTPSSSTPKPPVIKLSPTLKPSLTLKLSNQTTAPTHSSIPTPRPSSLPTDPDDDFHPVTIDHTNHTTIVHKLSNSTTATHPISSTPVHSSSASSFTPSSKSDNTPTPTHTPTHSHPLTPALNPKPISAPITFEKTPPKPSPHTSHPSSTPTHTPKPASHPSITPSATSSTTPSTPSTTPSSTPQPPSSSHRYNTRHNYTPVEFIVQNFGNSRSGSPPRDSSPTSRGNPSKNPDLRPTPSVNGKNAPKLPPTPSSPPNGTTGEKSAPSSPPSSSTSANGKKSRSRSSKSNLDDSTANGISDDTLDNNSNNTSNNTTHNTSPNNTSNNPSHNPSLDISHDTPNNTINNTENNTENNIPNDDAINTSHKTSNKTQNSTQNVQTIYDIDTDDVITTNNAENNANSSNPDYNNGTDYAHDADYVSESKNSPNENTNIIIKADSPSSLIVSAVVGPIDTKIHAIMDKYGLNVLSEHTIDFEAAPVRFFYELHKLEAEIASALQKEKQDYDMQVEIAKELQQILARRMENAPTPELKEKLKLEFSAIESELAKKEHNIAVVAELQFRHERIELNLKRAMAVVESLHADIQLPGRL